MAGLEAKRPSLPHLVVVWVKSKELFSLGFLASCREFQSEAHSSALGRLSGKLDSGPHDVLTAESLLFSL